jgi:hypothetical protein
MHKGPSLHCILDQLNSAHASISYIVFKNHSVLSSHLCLGLQNCPFCSSLQTNILCVYFSFSLYVIPVLIVEKIITSLEINSCHFLPKLGGGDKIVLMKH